MSAEPSSPAKEAPAAEPAAAPAAVAAEPAAAEPAAPVKAEEPAAAAAAAPAAAGEAPKAEGGAASPAREHDPDRRSRSRSRERKHRSRSRSRERRRRSRSRSRSRSGSRDRHRTRRSRFEEGDKEAAKPAAGPSSTDGVDPATAALIRQQVLLQQQLLLQQQAALQAQAVMAKAQAAKASTGGGGMRLSDKLEKATRELFVGNLAPGVVTEASLYQVFHSALIAAFPQAAQPGQEPVLKVNISGRFGFVEFRLPDYATAALQLNGQIALMGQTLKIARPSSYVEPAAQAGIGIYAQQQAGGMPAGFPGPPGAGGYGAPPAAAFPGPPGAQPAWHP